MYSYSSQKDVYSIPSHSSGTFIETKPAITALFPFLSLWPPLPLPHPGLSSLSWALLPFPSTWCYSWALFWACFPSFLCLPVMSRCSVLTASCTSGCATSLPTVPELEALTPPPSFQRQLGASRLFAKVLTAFGCGWEMWECSVTHVLPAGCFGNC